MEELNNTVRGRATRGPRPRRKGRCRASPAGRGRTAARRVRRSPRASRNPAAHRNIETTWRRAPDDPVR
jgi:hypothetical protein